MSANDTLIIGPFTFNVLKREGSRVLLSWIEKTGVYKERWIIIK